MKILAIDSSAIAASVCIEADGKIIAEAFQNNGLTHSVTLMPMLENMFKNCGEKIESIDKIAVSAGPGSFTGLRIGVSVAKGISWATGIPVCGVSTLEAMAWMASAHSGIICAVMDARAGQVYNALFRFQDGELLRLCQDRAIALSDLLEEIKNEKNIIILGDGAQMCYNRCEELGISAKIAEEAQRFIRASGVARVARGIEGGTPEQLEISYLRLPQAERERLAKIKSDSK